MTRALLAGGAALWLAGCSGATAPDAQPTVVAPGGTEVRATVAAQRATGSGLTAQVSPLSADTSGLNTRQSPLGLIVDLPADALFDFDQATLTAAAEVQLRKAADLIRSSPPGPVTVVGHTDAKGDDAYNQRLSEQRARAVADWFGQQVGVRTRQFVVSGKGETAPVAPNARPDGSDDPAGRTRNRRVEVIVPNTAGATQAVRP